MITLVCVTLILGPLESTESQPVSPSPSASQWAEKREKLLPFFAGRFRVIGCEPDSGNPYSGSVVITRQGQQLLVQELINGSSRTGTGVITFEPETPALEVGFGKSGLSAGYEPGNLDGQRQPRASGWVDPAGNKLSDRNRLGMEVWYNDQPAPSPALAQTKLDHASRNRMPPESLGVYAGKYRIIGEETGTGRPYTGRLETKLTGERLNINGWIDGKRISGEFVAEFLRSKELVLTVRCRVGRQSMVSQASVRMVGDNYPRICGYFYPVTNAGKIVTTASPKLETWFFDWR